MKRLATVILLAAALAAASTALAQAQRWEYAELRASQSDASYFVAPGFMLDFGFGRVNYTLVYNALAERYGRLAPSQVTRPTEEDNREFLDILNLLGNVGWEITHIYGNNYLLRRPLLD